MGSLPKYSSRTPVESVFDRYGGESFLLSAILLSTALIILGARRLILHKR
jgi:hypothetical protein